MSAATLFIHVREYGGAYIARCNGKTASSTAMPMFAAENAARKAAGVLLSLGVIAAVPEKLVLKGIVQGSLFSCEVGPCLPRRSSK